MRRPKLSATHGTARTRGRGQVLGLEGSIVWLAVLDKHGEAIGRIKFDARRIWRQHGLPKPGEILSYTETGDTVTEAKR
jgi:hypothetical protein